MAATTHSTTLSEVFCCGTCHSRVAFIEQIGGDLSYECQNPRCRRTIHSDCPEALGMLEDVIALPDRVALAMADILDFPMLRQLGAPIAAQRVQCEVA
jgi:hypothetical protein